MNTPFVVTVFALVYLGMMLGRLPRLQLDRTGVALLGAITLIAGGALDMPAAWAAVDIPTLALLFALMVVSAQLRLGGFYTWLTLRLERWQLSAPAFLLALVLVSGALSAVFTNDVICLAIAPVLVDLCWRRKLDPVPFLLALACSANVGSAATLIGNPQNILIGQALELSFVGYLRVAVWPTLLGLFALWGIIVWQARGVWQLAEHAAGVAREKLPDVRAELPGFDRWQTGKGLLVTGGMVLAFLLTDWPRDVVALGGAGVLLLSRRLHSRHMLGLVDWQLLVLFIGLFVVNHAFEQTRLPEQAVAALGGAGMDLSQPGWLFLLTVLLSNAVSNVPAVMLLLPFADGVNAGPVLALAGTLAGNLLIVGSIANIIVVDAAARHGIVIDWKHHARTGVPVTAVTLVIAALFLAV